MKRWIKEIKESIFGIKMNVPIGTLIENAVPKAIELAKTKGRKVRIKLNEKKLVVTKSSRVKDILAEYWGYN